MRYAGHVALGNINFSGNLGCAVTSGFQAVDLAEQLQRADLAASNIFDQTHQKAFFPRCFSDNRRNFGLAQRDEGFETTLTADEIVWFAVAWLVPASDRNWSLQSKIRNVRYHSLKSHSIAAPWIQNVYLVCRDHLNDRSSIVHAASGILAR
jgi:hypothetical protein